MILILILFYIDISYGNIINRNINNLKNRFNNLINFINNNNINIDHNKKQLIYDKYYLQHNHHNDADLNIVIDCYHNNNRYNNNNEQENINYNMIYVDKDKAKANNNHHFMKRLNYASLLCRDVYYYTSINQKLKNNFKNKILSVDYINVDNMRVNTIPSSSSTSSSRHSDNIENEIILSIDQNGYPDCIMKFVIYHNDNSDFDDATKDDRSRGYAGGSSRRSTVNEKKFQDCSYDIWIVCRGISDVVFPTFSIHSSIYLSTTYSSIYLSTTHSSIYLPTTHPSIHIYIFIFKIIYSTIHPKLIYHAILLRYFKHERRTLGFLLVFYHSQPRKSLYPSTNLQ